MHYREPIVQLAKKNTTFRTVVSTNQHSQVVLMSLKPGEDIGAEVHAVDQVLVFVEGQGTAIINDEKMDIVSGDLVVVPAGAKHNFINGPDAPMKLYTVYAPPEHRHGTTHKTKADAEKDERDHAG